MLSIVLFFPLFAADTAAAQTIDDETVAVGSAKLTAINLPAGARRINDTSVPYEIKETLSKLATAGGEKVRQGNSEVIIWSGNFQKASGARMAANLETALRNSGWEYEIGEKNGEFTLFSLFRTAPARRGLVGFFVPSEEVFIFAVTEIVKTDAPFALTENSTPDERTQKRPTAINDAGGLSIYGKWHRTTGGGSIDYTGKTQYKAGEDFYFEFFADGTVEYARKKDVLSIMQCKITGADNARGTFSISGNTLVIKLGAMKSSGTNSCEAKGNFNKTLEPSTINVQFQIKKMDNIARPDKPTIMCFNGSDEVCFEKVGK